VVDASGPGFRIEGLDHVAIEVADLDDAERWYAEVLGLVRAIPEWDPPRVMAAGGSGLALFPIAAGDSVEPLPHMNHIAFRVDRANFDAAREGLAERGVEVRFSDHGQAHSVYFTDPDGHRLELTTYEVS
jgi:catechol 2,3-dioxygenase-like lactoylglutathione lyase family enzyme